MKVIYQENINKEEEIINIINNNGVIVMPTDTVYGIVCSAVNTEAIDKAYQLKDRDYSKAMIILVSNKEMLHKYTIDISELEEELIMDSPCPTTVVLKRNERLLPDILCSSSTEIAVRRPNDEKLLEIIDKVNIPVVATSANKSHNKTITDISLLDEDIKNSLDLIVDGGHIDRGASTIVKVIDGKIKILRENETTYKLIDKYKEMII